MNKSLLRHALPWTTAALLAACGGDKASEPAAPQSVVISGKAVDGPLQGATACLDLNANNACDGTEPRSAATAADGSFSLAVPAAEAGRHRVVVEVPASAIDADTGAAVGTPFTLVAPASSHPGNVFVSPLTTLVQAHMDLNAATLAEATDYVRSQAGLGLSPLADFTAGTTTSNSADHRHAALVARLLQLTALAQQAELAAVVGTVDRTGTTVTAADLQRESQRSLLAALPAVAGAAIDPGLENSSGTALQAQLQTLARALTAQVGLNADVLRAAATFATLQASDPPAPGAGATLTALRYTSRDDWYMRTLQSSAADNVADGQNNLRFYDVRTQATPSPLDGRGLVRSWAATFSQARAGDRSWSGSAWVDCSLGQRSLSRARDAAGRSSFDFCNGRSLGNTVRRVLDISGQSLLSVVRDRIRSYPGGSAGVSFSNWGPSDLSLYGSAVFPTGSQLIYQSEVSTGSAYGYDVQTSNRVLAFNAAVAAGGDARATPSLACNDPLQNVTAAQTAVTTLETLIARNGGQPCIFNQGGATPNFSLNPNEWWGNSTVSLGDITGGNSLPDNTGNYYNTTAGLRVSFASSGNGATFWRCYRRASDNSPRNCGRIGSGRWSIQTLGDARVLSFTVMPALAQRLSYARVFVERGGQVYFGFKNPVGDITSDVRLNLVGANAVQQQLGLPRTRPVTAAGTATGTRAANLALLKGAWGGADPSGTEAAFFRFGDNGRFLLAEATPFLAFTYEQSGLEIGWLDHDPTTGQISSLLELDTSLTSGTSHPNPGDTPLTVSASSLGVDNGNIPRLVNDPAGLVGLWARGSTTDLNVTHLAFFANGRVMLVDPQGGDSQACPASAHPPGVEFASWSFDGQTRELRLFGKIYDTNGCDGIFDSSPASISAGTDNLDALITLSFATDMNSFSFVNGDGQTETWFRIPVQ